MTDKELKKLKDDLWHSADVLRSSAHLAVNKYGQSILGLIFPPLLRSVSNDADRSERQRACR